MDTTASGDGSDTPTTWISTEGTTMVAQDCATQPECQDSQELLYGGIGLVIGVVVTLVIGAVVILLQRRRSDRHHGEMNESGRDFMSEAPQQEYANSGPAANGARRGTTYENLDARIQRESPKTTPHSHRIENEYEAPKAAKNCADNSNTESAKEEDADASSSSSNSPMSTPHSSRRSSKTDFLPPPPDDDQRASRRSNFSFPPPPDEDLTALNEAADQIRAITIELPEPVEEEKVNKEVVKPVIPLKPTLAPKPVLAVAKDSKPDSEETLELSDVKTAAEPGEAFFESASAPENRTGSESTESESESDPEDNGEGNVSNASSTLDLTKDDGNIASTTL